VADSSTYPIHISFGPTRAASSNLQRRCWHHHPAGYSDLHRTSLPTGLPLLAMQVSCSLSAIRSSEPSQLCWQRHGDLRCR